MAIRAIKAEVKGGALAFLGGARAMNILGDVVASSSVPKAWDGMLKTFLNTSSDAGLFKLGGHVIQKNGFFVHVKGQAYKSKHHPGPAYWEIADGVDHIAPMQLAALVRQVLADPRTDCGDPWVATLVAAMFLSEVVRNPRSLIVNLMLLDLIESATPYGRQQDKELDFRKLLVFGGGGEKQSEYTYQGDKGPVTQKVDAKDGTLRGGKLPMSQLDAMKQFQSTTVKPYQNKFDKGFGELQKQATLNLQAPAQGGYHFATPVLEKECSVMLRWLLAYFTRHSVKLKLGSTFEEVEKVNPWAPNGPKVKSRVEKFQFGDVLLTGLREHVCDAAWANCAAPFAKGSLQETLLTEVQKALARRATLTEQLLT